MRGGGESRRGATTGAADGVTPLVGGNAGFAGERGDFGHLSEAQVRGSDYFGDPPAEGTAAGGVCAYPYVLPVRNPSAPLFEGPYRTRAEKILARYPDRMAALLPLLNLAHEIRGWLAPDALERVADIIGVAPAYVRGVATFYTMYNKRPVGRYLIQVCTNVCCSVSGADEVLETLLEQTGLEPGEISDDGLFTFMEVECLGACGFPVAIQINDRSFENVSVDDVPALLERLRTEAASLPEDGAMTIDAGAAIAATAGAGASRSDASRQPQTPPPDRGRLAGSVDYHGAGFERGGPRPPAVPPTEGQSDAGAPDTGPAGPSVTPSSQPHERGRASGTKQGGDD